LERPPRCSFAKKFHRREITAQGSETDAGYEHWPVCRVGLTGNTGMVDFNRAMLSFFAHPGVTRGNAAHFAHRAMAFRETSRAEMVMRRRANLQVSPDHRCHRRREPDPPPL
jgi:hypothetical protein